jgi:DnaJ-class molecular chaperone
METVQKAFTKLALQYHPDLKGKTAAESSISTEHFIRIRQAYEKIKKGDFQEDQSITGRHGKQRYGRPHHHRHHHENRDFSERAFLQYFFEQTGLRFTSAQRREMILLHRTRIPGGRYDGPSWDIARRLAAEQEVFLEGRPHDMQDWWNGTTAEEIRGHGMHDNQNMSRRRRRR